MYTEKQIKGYAKALRKALAARNLELSHAQSLELVAETLGEKSWNHLSAKIGKPPSEIAGYLIPEGWFPTGTHYRDCYYVSVEENQSEKAILLQCVNTKPSSFVSLMQQFKAENYLDHHIKICAEVKTERVGYASLWARVDGARGETLSFDNMYDTPPLRALTDTNDWTALELVLDVPEGATKVNFGCMLSGAGSAWFRNFSFERVSKDTPVSNKISRSSDGPTNLGLN